MSQDKQTYKRTNYFIKKNFQVRFILKFCLLLLAGVILSTALLSLFSKDTLTSSFQRSRLVIENTALAILPSVLYTSLITVGVLTIAAIIVTLFVSHKIAGPMFRFEKELKEIGRGDLTKKIILRSKDQASELADSINDMAARLHDKVVNILTEVERILEYARRERAPQKIIQDLERLHQEIMKNLKT